MLKKVRTKGGSHESGHFDGGRYVHPDAFGEPTEGPSVPNITLCRKNRNATPTLLARLLWIVATQVCLATASLHLLVVDQSSVSEIAGAGLWH
jgi:hypothetical protein